MKNEKVTPENLLEDWRNIGGSALIAKIMNNEVPPTADPLGPENRSGLRHALPGT